MAALLAGMMGSLAPEMMRTRFLGKIGLRKFCQRHHGAQENCSTQNFRSQQKYGSRNICTVGKTNGNGVCLFIGFASFDDEIGQFMGALDDILLVKYTFCQASEKPGHAIFENFATGRKQRTVGCQGFAQWQQVVFVPAGSVEQKKGRSSRCTGFKTMDK